MTLTIPGAGEADSEPLRSGSVAPIGVASPGSHELSVWTDQRANRCTLRLRGRLGAETVRLLDEHVDRLGCRWCDEVVMDLYGLTRIDAVGARLVAGFGHYVRARGGTFRVDGAAPTVAASIDEAERELS